MTTRKTVTATICNGDEKIRITLPPPVDYSTNQEHGIEVRDVYIGTKWVVIETHSCWDAGNGRCCGIEYTTYDLTNRVHRDDLLNRRDIQDCEEIFEAIDKHQTPIEA